MVHCPSRPCSRSAVLVRPAKLARGKCCPKFKCQRNRTRECELLAAKTPCITEAFCPLCHSLTIVTPANPDEGVCCPVTTCVKDQQCLCNLRTDPCPTAACSPLETTVQSAPADPSSGVCCPTYTCKLNETAVCAAQRAARNYTAPVCQNPCDRAIITHQADTSSVERCFPRFRCRTDYSLPCCGFNYNKCRVPRCRGKPYHDAVQLLPASPSDGLCCATYGCLLNTTALCEAEPTADECLK